MCCPTDPMSLLSRVPSRAAGVIPAATAIILLLVPSLDAATWTVDPGGGGNAVTIAEGLTFASSGDTVLVNPGTYYESLLMANGVILRSRDGAATTVIDGSGTGQIIMCIGSIPATSIEGFTLTHGYTDSLGGAIACYWGANPHIADNVITQNEGLTGAAIGCYQYSSPVIERNEVTDNTASLECGGVMAVANCDPVIRDNIFRRNVSDTRSGGAMWFGASCRVTVIGNVITDNTCAQSGAGIRIGNALEGPQIEIAHNLFVRNQAGEDGGAIFIGVVAGMAIRNNTIARCSAGGQGGGIWIGDGDLIDLSLNIVSRCTNGGVGLGSGAAVLGCNDLWNNPDGDYAGTITPGGDDIHDDPQFCDADVDDYTLNESSPCLHASCGTIGAFGPGCGVIALEDGSWGSVKALFR